MNRQSFIGVLMAAVSGAITAGSTVIAAEPKPADQPNSLTAEEQAAGWRLLFDGTTTRGWRGFRKQAFPEKGWGVENGCLKHVAGAGGGDIVTEEEFLDFDLRWEWRLPAKANNGVKYLITEQRGVGHEYQMLGDWRSADQLRGAKWQTAAFYDVLAPEKSVPLRPVGEWNHSRVLVQGNHVEHWLNGEKVLEYELGSASLAAAVAQSKFKKVTGFGTKLKGRILLTDHRDEAVFRNIKIRALPAQ